MLWFYAATGRRLIADEADQRVVSGISRSYLPGMPIYGAGDARRVHLEPDSRSILYGGIALFYVLESSLFGRD